jgi:probable rRNA maturation factor
MNSQPFDINFHYQSGRFYFPNRKALKKFISGYMKKNGPGLQAVNIIFCSDKEILQVNQQYLHHDFFTDIITFELSEKGRPVLADIFISTDRVKENARTFQTSFTKELHRVIFHGFLHLLGFKDKSEEKQKEMRAQEMKLLNRYFKK